MTEITTVPLPGEMVKEEEDLVETQLSSRSERRQVKRRHISNKQYLGRRILGWSASRQE